MVSMFIIFFIIDDIIMVLNKMLTMPMTARMLGKEEDLPNEGDVDAAVLALVRSSCIDYNGCQHCHQSFDYH